MKRLLILLLFVSPTIQYRVELGSFSFALMEPLVVMVSAILLIHQWSSRGSIFVLKDHLVSFTLALMLWVFLIRPWATDWQHGLSDARDWAIPVMSFIALTSTIRKGWRHWIALFSCWVLVNALFGVYQHFTDSFRPLVAESAALKTGFTVSPEDGQLMLVSYAVAFFSHPNGFAIYLFLGLMLALGRLAGNRGSLRVWKLAMVGVIALALLWTYAKASLLVMGFSVCVFGLVLWVKSDRRLLVLIGVLFAAGTAGLLIATQFVPEALLTTLEWRAGLWRTALDVIAENPTILLVGNGIDVFAGQAYYFQPHNLYLYLLLEYGVVGLVWIALLIRHIGMFGWRMRQARLMRREPLLAALWVALLGYFGIGLVEAGLFGIENRMIFLLGAACFIGLARELRSEILTVPTPLGEPHVSAAIARSRAI